MLEKKYILFLIFFFPLVIAAQIDSSIQLRSVLISTVRSTGTISTLKIEKPDSLMRMISLDQTLGNYLNEFTPALIKNYGPGALSSVSLRGGSAYHIAVLWKGFSMANPMNGVMDFNLLPMFLFDDISIQYGGTSSLWGSGAISGTILLSTNNIIVKRNFIKVGSRYSTASGWANFAEGKFSIKKFNSSIKIFLTNENNQFSFHQNKVLKKQVHAEAKGRGIISENNYIFNERSLLSFNFWYQFSERNIAPVLTEFISDAVQRDKNFRYNATYTKLGNRGKFVFRNAIFNESLFYNDSSLTTPSNSLCKTFITEPEYSLAINNFHSLQTGINFTVIKAIATEFKKEADIIRKAAFIGYNYLNKKLNISLSARKEINEFKNPPVAFSWRINYELLKWLKISGSYSSVYRNPQVNDLFWQPGGNLNLLPETGISYESTFDFDFYRLAGKTTNDSNVFSYQITGFNKTIDNWIAWTPHGILWTPANIKNVRSYGTENSFLFKKKFHKVALRLNAFYAYTVSETTSSALAFDASVDKQLIYVPLHKAGGALSIIYKNTVLTFYQTYTGVRYTTTDNFSHLNAFNKTNIQIDQIINLQNTLLTMFIRVDNLLDKDYQSVLNRPEPLRNYSFGINISYKQKK